MFATGTTPLESIGGGIALGIWMYSGYNTISLIGGEIENPEVLPKGILLTIPLVILTFVLPTMAGLCSIGNWEAWTTAGSTEGVGYATVLAQYISPVCGQVFLITAIASQLSIFNGTIATGSRTFFVLADDGFFPKVLKKVSKNKGVPWIGILSISIVTIILLNFEFKALILIGVLPTFVNAILLALTVFKARKMYPVEERRKKGYTYVIPCGKAGLYYVVGAMIIVCIGSFLLNGADYFFAGLLCASAMIILYIILKRHYGGLSVLDPVMYPLNPKTKLCCGAVKSISAFCAALGATGIAGFFFLRWYEGDWGPEYYKEEYGDFIIFSDFDALLNSILIYGIVMSITAGITYYIHKKVG